jgi:hypothetical protein
MPFKSKKQRTFLQINEPEVYKKFKEEERRDNGGILNQEIDLNVAPDTYVTMSPQGVKGRVEGPTTIQGGIPFDKNKDAYAAIETEVYVDKDKRVYLRAWDREGTGGAGVGATVVGDNWSIDTTRSNGETRVEGKLAIPFGHGGMNGCPMDGAVIKGGTKIKPERYTHGKRKVKNGKTSTT